MSAVAERLGIPVERVEQIGYLKSPSLPQAKQLFDQAFSMVDHVAKRDTYAAMYGDAARFPAGDENTLEEAQILLAAALLEKAQSSSDGRISGALALIAQLVAKADPQKTLGPAGQALRQHLMPNGWEAMTRSWEHVRYAWREGMAQLLDANATAAGRAIVQALNEITRLQPGEPEPVRVNIQESFPAPRVAFAVSVIGLALTARSLIKEFRTKKR
jgi:hypothetical protein